MRLHPVLKTLAATAVVCATLAAPSLAHAQSTDLTATMNNQGQLGQFVAALDTSGVSSTLRDGGPYTVWAPTDAAFTGLPAAVQEQIKDPATLRSVLEYHLANGVVTAAQIVQVPNVRTLQGEPVRITTANGAVLINTARVVQPDLVASNGIIHVINGVLVPPSLMASLPRAGDAEEPAWPFVVTGLGLLMLAGGVLVRRQTSMRSMSAGSMPRRT